jgi:hypothetical protein
MGGTGPALARFLPAGALVRTLAGAALMPLPAASAIASRCRSSGPARFSASSIWPGSRSSLTGALLAARLRQTFVTMAFFALVTGWAADRCATC